ncbi:MAG: aminopeptidase P N-terminal domain-containing protein [Bdellovibrionales bacterium]|nr:aminopeptidase P N-terminal domain-containing protein [Bdellovibrionales bacterium]
MRKPTANLEECKQRRENLKTLAQGAAVIIPSHTEHIRNHDVHHSYRQDSNLFYLTGFEEPESVLVFRPGMTPETVLFVREKDETRETWDGFRYGPSLAKATFQMDATYVVDDVVEKAAELLADVEKVYYSQFRGSWFDKAFKKILTAVKIKKGRSGKGLLPVYDAYPLVGELRLFKSDYDIQQMRTACEISSAAHVELMKNTRPGVSERELHGLFIYEIMKHGCAREGYGSIVAGGKNACTLHYIFNDETLRDGDLLLVDAGGEYNYYSADITRAWPVSGKFTPAQKRIYQKVLDLQKSLVASIQPGVILKDHQAKAVEGLTDIMIDEKLLKGNRAELIKENAFRKYYPHGLGHYLGLDVHDAGAYELDGQSRPYEKGMVVTVEPGIYIPHNDETAPMELRGIGIRIEDDILVTNEGIENLTIKTPKEVAELEDLVGSSNS